MLKKQQQQQQQRQEQQQQQQQRHRAGKRGRTTHSLTAKPNNNTATRTTPSLLSFGLTTTTISTPITFDLSSLVLGATTPKRAVKPSRSNASELFASVGIEMSNSSTNIAGDHAIGGNVRQQQQLNIETSDEDKTDENDDNADREVRHQQQYYDVNHHHDEEENDNDNDRLQKTDAVAVNDVDEGIWRISPTSTTEEWKNRNDTIIQKCQRYCRRHIIASDADIETTKQCILVVMMLVGVLLLVIGHDTISDHYHDIKTHNEQVLDTLVVEASSDKYSAVQQAFHDAVNNGGNTNTNSVISNNSTLNNGVAVGNNINGNASVTRVIEIRNKTYETFHQLFVPISSGFCSYVRDAVQTVVDDNKNNYTTNATGDIQDDVHFIFDITIDCSKLFQFSPVSGTGNWMYLYYTMRLVALAQRHTSILFTCTDYSFSKDLPKDLALPWLTGWFPFVNTTAWKEDYDEKFIDVPTLEQACDDNFQDLVPIIPIVQQDLRRLAIGLIGPSSGHPSEIYAREHLSDNDSMNTYDATGSIYAVPVDYKNPFLGGGKSVITTTTTTTVNDNLPSNTTGNKSLRGSIEGNQEAERLDIYGTDVVNEIAAAAATTSSTTNTNTIVSSAIELDDVVIHFPCADVFDSASSGNNKLASLEEAYGFYKYSLLTQYISKEAKSIGILTQSYDDKRKEVSDAEHGPPSIDEQSAIIADPTINATTTASLLVDGVLPSVSDRCYKIISGLIHHIKKDFELFVMEEYNATMALASINDTLTNTSDSTQSVKKRPLPRITVHTSSHDTATVAIARMVMANQTIAAASSFSILAGMATFGTAYIPTNSKLRWLGQSRYENSTDGTSSTVRKYHSHRPKKHYKHEVTSTSLSTTSGTEGYYNATDDWGVIEFVDGTINNTFANIDDIVRIWVETSDGEQRILEWFRNDTYQL
jgi:hypothetical protein